MISVVVSVLFRSVGRASAYNNNAFAAEPGDESSDSEEVAPVGLNATRRSRGAAQQRPPRTFCRTPHGPNVVVSRDGRYARRPRPTHHFNQSLVMCEAPFVAGDLVSVRIDEVENKWIGSLEIGESKSKAPRLGFPTRGQRKTKIRN
jgi:hypothetical protein